jgi:Tol biopolymer transport system component
MKIAFRSDATNLVPNPPTDGQFEVYVKDLATGQTIMISREPDGSPDRGDAEEPQWSPDGTRLAFSLSTPPGGPVSTRTWEIADLHSGKITPLSQSNGTLVDPVIEFAWSPDGTRVAFQSSDPSLPNDGSPYGNMYIEDLATKFITLVSAPDNPQPGETGASGPSETPAWSPNGRYLAFNSSASNLIAGAHVGYLQEEVYVYDAETDKLSLASVALGGPPADGPNYDTFIASGDYAYASPAYEQWAWSPDSTRLLFASAADNLVAGNLTNQEQIYAKTLATGDLQIVSATVNGTPGDKRSGGWAEWSPDGTKVIFDSEAGNLGAPAGSILTKNMTGGALSLVGVGGTGCGCGTASMWSPDGEWVSFLGQLGQGLQAKNILTGALAQIAPSNTPGPPSLESRPAWSPDGTRIAFEVNDASLLPGVDGDQIYMRQVSTTKVSGGGHGGSSEGGDGGGGLEPPTPPEPPPSVYVALGDSYSSGEGNPPYLANSERTGNRCHRSALSYAYSDSIRLGFYASHFSFHACSGAKIKEFYTTNSGDHEPGQLTWLDSSTRLVTLTIGGNDAYFFPVIVTCIANALHLPGVPSCKALWSSRVEGAIAMMGSNVPNNGESLTLLYERIAHAAPRAKVMVIGYPRFFPSHPPTRCSTGVLWSHFSRTVMLWINSEILNMDNTAKRAARAARVTYVNGSYDAFDGHELCTKDPYLHSGIVSRHSGLFHSSSLVAGSFHPDLKGNVALAMLVQSHY